MLKCLGYVLIVKWGSGNEKKRHSEKETGDISKVESIGTSVSLLHFSTTKFTFPNITKYTAHMKNS